ncbi:MAG: phage tail tape measure protein family [Gaiellaceae bacterium]|nr:phage tail tape measure protein family [Gaiellaceae bacterium]
MADPIAEAFVAIRPDLSQFEGDLQRGITRALRGVTIPSSAQQNLGTQLFGPGFFSQVSTRTTQAVSGTKIPTTTQAGLAQALFGPGFRNETGRAIQGALVGLGGGQLAARFAFFGAGGAAIAAIASGFVASAQAAGTFEQSLNVLQATADATDEQLEQMAELARDLGADLTLPAVTAQNAADAMTELARAGLDVNEVMGAARGTLQLATAANTDVATAARIVATSLNAFNLAGEEATRVADLLAAASINASGDMQDFALAIQQSAAVADLAGLTIDQLVGALTLLANRGLIGSDAGTSLRTALLRLIPTTREAAQFMEVLGIQIDRTRTVGQQLPDLLDQYQASLARLNPTLRQAVLAQIAGQDAVRSLSFLIEGGGDELERYIELTSQGGEAQRLTEARTEGFLGALQGLNSQLQTLSTNVGGLFIPVLTEVTRVVTGLIAPINELFEALRKLDDLDISVDIDFPDPPDWLDAPFFDVDDVIPSDLAALLRDRLNPIPISIRATVTAARELRGALEDLGFVDAANEAEDLAERAERLNEELFAAGTTRARRIQIQTELRVIARELDDLSATAKRSADTTADVFTTAFGPLADALRPPLQQLESQLQAAVDPNVLGRQLQRALALLQRGDISDQAREAARGLVSSLIEELASLGPEGERVLTSLGGRLMQALGDGITAEEQVAINAARRALGQVIQEGERQVLEAIRSARGNLESLGEGLGDDLGEIIEIGPIGQAIDRIEEELDRLQETVTRRQLRFDFREAKRDLRDAKEAIIQVGELTPAQKRAQQEFLEPFQEKVKDAKSSLREFDLTEQQEQLEATRDAAIDAADKGIQRLILKFEEGKLSAGEFETALRRELGPAFDILGSKAASALDPFVVINFRREVDALIEQAKALSAFFPLGGSTTPGATVVKPAETQAQVNQRIAESAASLARIEADAKRLSAEEQDKQQAVIGILKQIARALGVGGPAGGGKASTVPSKTPTIRGGD